MPLQAPGIGRGNNAVGGAINAMGVVQSQRIQREQHQMDKDEVAYSRDQDQQALEQQALEMFLSGAQQAIRDGDMAKAQQVSSYVRSELGLEDDMLDQNDMDAAAQMVGPAPAAETVVVAPGGALVEKPTGNEVYRNPKDQAPPKPSNLEKETEYVSRLMGITDNEGKSRIAAELKGKGITMTLSDGTKVQIGGSNLDKTGPTQSQMTKQNELWQEYDSMIENVEIMIADVEKDPSLVGVVGSARKAAQTATGVTEDFSRLIGEIPVVGTVFDWASEMVDNDSDLSDEQKAKFSDDPKLSKLRLFENNLGLALARSRHPTGRIPVDIINRSIADAKLTGMTSSRDVIYRMREILSMLQENRTNVEQVMEGETGPKPSMRYVPGSGLVPFE